MKSASHAGDRRTRPVARCGHGQPRCPPKVDSRPCGRCRGVPTAAAAEALTPSGGQAWQLAHAPVAPSFFLKCLSQESRGQVPDGEAMENGLPRPLSPAQAPGPSKSREPSSTGALVAFPGSLDRDPAPLFIEKQGIRAFDKPQTLPGMARTRARLSGPPTCRRGVICPGLGAFGA